MRQFHVHGYLADGLPLVGGEWIVDSSLLHDTPIIGFNPSTGRPFSKMPPPTALLADIAMSSAHKAWLKWSCSSIDFRRECILRLAEAIEKRRESFVSIIQIETGILYNRANEEVSHGVELLRETAELPALTNESISQTGLPDATIMYNSYGVVVWIMSWNSPLASLCKISSPLITGNTIVLKVSHHAMACGFLFAEAVKESGFPPGVINVLWDEDGLIASSLVSNPLLGKCAFTGSLNTAKNILNNISTSAVRPTFFETGGGGVQIIFDDADLDKAIPHIFWGAFTLSGQICCAGTKVFVHEKIFERFISEVGGILQSIKIGSALEKSTHIGPVIFSSEVSRIKRMTENAKFSGSVIIGAEQSIPDEGFFVPPQIALADDIMNPLFQTEIFGPVMAVMPFSEKDETLLLVGQLQTGLTIAFYTSDTAWVMSNISNLTFGTIWINGYYQSSYKLPFGGMKNSGYGRERGIAGLREFSQEKVIVCG